MYRTLVFLLLFLKILAFLNGLFYIEIVLLYLSKEKKYTGRKTMKRRLLSFTLTLVMLLSSLAGLAITANADTGSLVSNVSDVVEGEYVITWDNTYYLPSETAASSSPAVGTGISVSNNILANTITSAMKWTFTGNNNDGFIISHSNGNTTYYLNSTNSSTGISVTNSSSTTWKVSIDNTKGMLLKGSDSGSRYLAVYNNNGTWRYYGTSNYSGTLRLYKITTGGHEHTWGDWESNNDGTHTRTCTSDSSHTQTENCNFGDYFNVTEPTCNTAGSGEHTCSDCGYTCTDIFPATEVHIDTDGDGKCNGCEQEKATDILSVNLIGETGNTYTEWDNKKSNSDAVYKGKSITNGTSIQLNNNDSKPGIVTTDSGGKVIKIKVNFGSNTSTNRELIIYGKNTPYSSAADLYSQNDQGDELATITKGQDLSYTIDSSNSNINNHKYIGFCSGNGAMYIESVYIIWDTSCAHENVEHHSRVEASCTQNGNIEYWKCNDCDKIFSDSGLTQVISEQATVLAALGHIRPNDDADYTFSHNKHTFVCSRCQSSITEDCTFENNTCTYCKHQIEAPSYYLFTGSLVEGDYIIVYNGNALKNVVSNDRLQNEVVNPQNDAISTTNTSIIWHIAPSGEYWTVYCKESNSYAASTGAKSKAQMLSSGTDDKSLWTISATAENTYDFINKQNTANGVNAHLRYNSGYGFACYAASTGGAFTLYKLHNVSASCSLTTGSKIAINLYFEDLPTCAHVYKDGTTELVKKDDKYTIEVSAKDYDATYEITVEDAGGNIIQVGGKDIIEVSVNDYYEAMENDSTTLVPGGKTAGEVVQAMSDYSKFAAAYFKGTGIDSTAINNWDTINDIVESDIVAPTYSHSGQSSVLCDGVSLILESETILRFWFYAPGYADTATVSVVLSEDTSTSKPFTKSVDGDYVKVDIKLAAKELATAFDVSVTANSKTATVTNYAATNYIAKTINRGGSQELSTERNQQLLQVIKALYVYYLNAKGYFG